MKSKTVDISRLMTIKNYSLRENVTTSYIYKLIKAGVMSSLDIDGVQFIDIKQFATIPVVNRRK
jgi:hypothetical protein